jgi:hypothetical protein
MADVRNHLLSTSWLAEQTIPEGTHRLRVWGLDDPTTPTAHAAVWFRLKDGEGDGAPLLIAAGSVWEEVFAGTTLRAGMRYSLMAVSGAPYGIVEIV